MTSSPDAELTHVAATSTAVVRSSVPVAELAQFFDRSFSTLAAVIASQDVVITGPAFARYHGPLTDTVDLEVGFPTAQPVTPADGVEPGSLPGGPVAHLVHHGGYDQLGSSWERLARWMSERGLEAATSFWEVYVTQPSPEMDPADLRTELIWPTAR